MTQDTIWEHEVAVTAQILLEHNWEITSIRRGGPSSYTLKAKLGKWEIELLATPEFSDTGALIDSATGDFVRLDGNRSSVRHHAYFDEEDLAQIFAIERKHNRVIVAKPTNTVAELAEAIALEDRDRIAGCLGIQDRTLDVLNRAGIQTIRDLKLRSDQQLLAITGFGQRELEDLQRELKFHLSEANA